MMQLVNTIAFIEILLSQFNLIENCNEVLEICGDTCEYTFLLMGRLDKTKHLFRMRTTLQSVNEKETFDDL